MAVTLPTTRTEERRDGPGALPLRPCHTPHRDQPAGGRDEPVPAAARPQPGRLVPVGAGGAGRAREQDRPIFLSIGYSACHWCHVMERESFEDEATAEQLNRDFVAIKVDREERPDLDDVYMAAVQALTGGGGWPMSVFLTPELRAVLRRHLLPARRPPRPAGLPAGARRGGRCVPQPPRRGDGSRAASWRGTCASRLPSRRASGIPASRAWTRPRRALARASTRSTAASAGRRSSRRR